MQGHDITVRKAHANRLSSALIEQIDTIFFEASSRTFPPARSATPSATAGSAATKGGSDALFLALQGEDTVAGYLVGAVENPALQERFADIGYFRTEFAELCRHFPAHLHINLSPAYRSRGIGARLIEAFADYASGQGAVGMHIVTGQSMRNVRFYERCGFKERGRAPWKDGEVVFLARALEPSPAQGSASVAR